eukprot:1149912-Pelagomonas_calceolata.AAC.4
MYAAITTATAHTGRQGILNDFTLHIATDTLALSDKGTLLSCALTVVALHTNPFNSKHYIENLNKAHTKTEAQPGRDPKHEASSQNQQGRNDDDLSISSNCHFLNTLEKPILPLLHG